MKSDAGTDAAHLNAVRYATFRTLSVKLLSASAALRTIPHHNRAPAILFLIAPLPFLRLMIAYPPLCRTGSAPAGHNVIKAFPINATGGHTNGSMYVFAGWYGNDTWGYTTTYGYKDGIGTNAQFNNPNGLFIQRTGKDGCGLSVGRRNDMPRARCRFPVAASRSLLL